MGRVSRIIMTSPRPVSRRPGTRRQKPGVSGKSAKSGRPLAESLHPRNRHKGRYDLTRLIQVYPKLRRFVARNAHGDDSIDFANPYAVKALNAALLADWYGIVAWEVPAGYLCPPIPGRADYLHHVADLLAADAAGVIPRGTSLRVLDIGVGASLVYPLIGHGEYGWRFVGTEITPAAIVAAKHILAKNPRPAGAIEIRHQTSALRIFQGVVSADEYFDLTICNPPYHASADEAQAGSKRKWRNLGRAPHGAEAHAPVMLNFGGQATELWCPGGEVAFITRMIVESALHYTNCCWFTTLVAKESHLATIEQAARRARVRDLRILPMGQGQKHSRIVAWTFHDLSRRQSWRADHP